MAVLERIVDNFKTELRANFLAGGIETQLFFTEEMQAKFREEFSGLVRPMDPRNLRDVAASTPLIIMVEAVMWYLGFFKTEDLEVYKFIISLNTIT